MRYVVIVILSIAMLSCTRIDVRADESQTVREYYEHIHKFPELGKEEFKTADFVRGKLKEFGYKDLLTVGSVPTTVIALLDSGKPGPVICFRSEMDARKCEEQSGLPYSSTISGVMHNCGHDAHAAILLETARRLMQDKVNLKGKVVFLFQPAEECPGGADDIVKDGILARLGVENIIAMHCSPGLEVGKFTLHPGPVMAGSNYLTIKLTGKGGHAAQPHDRDDLSGLASLITLELQRLPARCMDVIKYPTVCSISTSKWSSEQANVAPDSITLGGTVRAFYDMDEKLFRGKSFRELVDQLISGLSSAYGANYSVELRTGSPVTINDPQLCANLLSQLRGVGINIDDSDRAMFSEDFAYYTKSIPCAYFGLGIASEKLGHESVHSSKFTVNEECLQYGVRLYRAIAGLP